MAIQSNPPCELKVRQDDRPIHRYYLGDYYDDEWMDKGTQTVINGSRRTRQELEARMAWWTNRPLEHIPPRPLDTDGKPMRFCSGGHYAPQGYFGMRQRNKDGLDDYCRQCRKVQAQRHKLARAS